MNNKYGESWFFQHDDSRDESLAPVWENQDRAQFLGDYVTGRRPVSEYVHRIYSSKTDDGKALDFAWSEGTNGLFSQRFVDLIKPYYTRCFSLLPATLDDQPFYFFRHESSIDCLDHEHSDVQYFEHNPSKVMSVKKKVFKTEMLADPILFGVSELPAYMFWTKPLVDICMNANMTGIRFVSIDRINKNNGWIPPVWQTDSD